MAEAALVRRVAGTQGVLRGGVGGPDGGLLPPGPLRLGARTLGALADPRVRVEGLLNLGPVERAGGALGRVQQGADVRVGATGEDLCDPSR